MEYSDFAERERHGEVIVTTPAMELLLDPEQAANMWPDLTSEPAFLYQISQRAELATNIDAVVSALPTPTTPIQSAVESGALESSVVANVYTGLANLLSDPDYMHALLYLPFEWIPSSEWQPADDTLFDAVDGFKTAYMRAWFQQLSQHNARANFVDGDVLESELRTTDIERVVKVSHLIPQLVQCGMLTVDEVINQLDISRDTLLRSNLRDMLVVVDDMGLLPDHALQRLSLSPIDYVRSAAEHIQVARDSDLSTGTTHSVSPQPVASMQPSLTARLASEEDQADAFVSEKRLAWLKKRRTEEAIDEWSDRLCDTLLQAQQEQQLEPIQTYRGSSLASQVFVNGIRKTIEQLAIDDEHPAEFFAHYELVLESMWQNPDDAVKQQLVKLYRHAHALGIVTDEFLSERFIHHPNLSAPFSAHLAQIEPEIHRIRHKIEALDPHTELGEMIYPVISISGSRLKGYGDDDSDIDVGVFVRPDVPFEKRHRLRQLLAEVLADEPRFDTPVEFWLMDDGESLLVQDIAEPDFPVASSHLTNVLFMSVWVGEKTAALELQQQLLPSYFYETGYENGVRARTRYIERLEQDNLQYRLMHKGYDKHYPRVSRPQTHWLDLIDGTSAFWDSGFRQMASQMFVNTVFLPRLGS